MIFRPALQHKILTILVILLLTSLFIVPQTSSAQADGAPKLANYYISWDVSDDQAKELAKWDLVILAPQAAERNPDVIQVIRQTNPKTKILVYISAVDLNHTVVNASPLLKKIYNQVNNNSWWLNNTAGQHLSGWPNSWVINPAISAPRVNNQNWSNYLPQLVNDEFLKNSQYDGVFFDNLWPSVSWLNQPVDLNGDGQIDTPAQRDNDWQAGLTHIITQVRNLGPGKIILANNTSNFYNANLNGRMEEMFPNSNEGGWSGSMKDYVNNGLGYAPQYFIINGGTKNTGANKDYANLRLSLTSSLLADGFFSFDYGDQNHGNLWWYDEYNVFLGKPVSADKNLLNQSSTDIQPSVWQRDFQNGVILVNSTSNTQKVQLPNELEKIKGSQDTTINNGAIVKSVSINPNDGLVLLRRIEDIKNTPYYNGSFVRVYNQSGQTNRNGFFLYDKNYKGNNLVAKQDLNNDGKLESVVATSNQISVYDDSQKMIASFYPYGANFIGGINFALADFNRDNQWEIVTAPAKGSAPLVKIFDLNGNSQGNGFYAYAKNFTGGVTLAACSTKGNGNTEIITGSATGDSAQIRIFDQKGKLLSGGIKAYGASFKGGVNVACGDVNADGKDEIITGPGFGGSTLVKIFNYKFQTLNSGFYAYDQTNKNGVRVMAADIDGDGVKEILAATPDVFTTAVKK